MLHLVSDVIIVYFMAYLYGLIKLALERVEYNVLHYSVVLFYRLYINGLPHQQLRLQQKFPGTRVDPR